MKKKLSLKQFIFSMFTLFLISSLYLGGLYFILNQPLIQSQPWEIGPVTTKPVSLTLNLTSPDNNLLVFSPDLLLAGKTAPQGIVIFSFENDSQAFRANNQGDFSLTLKLEEGANYLTVSAFDDLGNSKVEKRIVYFSEEKI